MTAVQMAAATKNNPDPASARSAANKKAKRCAKKATRYVSEDAPCVCVIYSPRKPAPMTTVATNAM